MINTGALESMDSFSGAELSPVTPSSITTNCAGLEPCSVASNIDGRGVPNVLTYETAVSSSRVIGMSRKGLPYRSRDVYITVSMTCLAFKTVSQDKKQASLTLWRKMCRAISFGILGAGSEGWLDCEDDLNR